MKQLDATLKVVLTVQALVFIMVGLDAVGLHLLVVNQVIGFVYLTFIPGILLLKIFKFRELHLVDRLLYSVGLSIAFIIVTGLLVNALYPAIGILKPISFAPLIFTISALVLACLLYTSPSPRDRS